MDNLRKSMIEELMLTLKIPQGNFNFGTIASEIEHIPDTNLKEFYIAVMSADTFGNGMKAIINSAEEFKPKDNNINERAKKLISFVETQNTVIGELAKARGIDFNNLVRELKPIDKYSKSFAVMTLVSPYYDAKELIINIRHYQTSIEALNAFKQAITTYDNQENHVAIENSKVKKMIERVAS